MKAEVKLLIGTVPGQDESLQSSAMHGAVNLCRTGRSSRVITDASWSPLRHRPTPLDTLSLSINYSLSSPPSSLCQSHCSSSANPPSTRSNPSLTLPTLVFFCLNSFVLQSFSPLSHFLRFVFLILFTVAPVSSHTTLLVQ